MLTQRGAAIGVGRQFMDALQEKKFQKHVAAEFIGTLLFTFLAGAGVSAGTLLRSSGLRAAELRSFAASCSADGSAEAKRSLAHTICQ